MGCWVQLEPEGGLGASWVTDGQLGPTALACSRAGLTDVLAQHVLDLLLVEATTEDETLGRVHRALGTQLGVQEHEDVLGLAVKTAADVDEVGKRRLLRSLAGDLRRNDGVPTLLAGELGVVDVQEGVEALQQLGVGGVTVLGHPRVDTTVRR
jgi:hypothetical protein